MRSFWAIVAAGLAVIAAISQGMDAYDASFQQMRAELSGGKLIVTRK